MFCDSLFNIQKMKIKKYTISARIWPNFPISAASRLQLAPATGRMSSLFPMPSLGWPFRGLPPLLCAHSPMAALLFNTGKFGRWLHCRHHCWRFAHSTG
jgi:hypothetical protein